MPTNPFERATDTAIHDWLDTRPDEQATLETMARTYIDEAREVAGAAGWTWAPRHAVRQMGFALETMYRPSSSHRLVDVIMRTAVEHVDWHAIAQPYIDRILDAEEAGLPADVGADAFGEPPSPKETTV